MTSEEKSQLFSITWTTKLKSLFYMWILHKSSNCSQRSQRDYGTPYRCMLWDWKSEEGKDIFYLFTILYSHGSFTSHKVVTNFVFTLHKVVTHSFNTLHEVVIIFLIHYIKWLQILLTHNMKVVKSWGGSQLFKCIVKLFIHEKGW